MSKNDARNASARTAREESVTPESAFLNRREWIKLAGLTGLGASGLLPGCQRGATAQASEAGQPQTAAVPQALEDLYPAARNASFKLDRPVTAAGVAATHNNFYEFSLDKAAVSKLVGKFVIRPWEIEIGGLVKKPLKIDVDELCRKMALEERLYRFRCVEAWAMAVPWIGFPMHKLIRIVGKHGVEFPFAKRNSSVSVLFTVFFRLQGFVCRFSKGRGFAPPAEQIQFLVKNNLLIG